LYSNSGKKAGLFSGILLDLEGHRRVEVKFGQKEVLIEKNKITN